MFGTIALWLFSAVLAAALAPKPPKPKAASLEDFQVPTADPSRSIPVVFGTVWINDPNIVWWGHLRVEDIRKDGGMFHSDVTVGYKYYLGAHAAICFPVDRVLGFRYGDRNAWSGDVTSGDTYVSAAGLFGGEDREGGFEGVIQYLDGNSTQGANAYLQARLGTPIPAFRGVLTAVFKQTYWGTSAYLKNPSWKVRRVAMHTDFNTIWYSAKANINGNMNAAHILYEVLTQPWGMGYPTTRMGSSFTAAADTFYSEGMGLSMKWSISTTIEDFLQTVLDHCNAVIDTDRATGKFEIIPIRDDYNVGSLPSLSTSNSHLDSYERTGYGETVNVFTVYYTDPDTGKEQPATVTNLANIQAQGDIVPESISLPGITSLDLAARVAHTYLKAKSTPLAYIELSNVFLDNYTLGRGSVFVYSNTRLGFLNVVFRIIDIEYPAIDSSDGIKIKAVEDVFGLSQSTYVEQQSSGWTSPLTAPANALQLTAYEASYYELIKNLTSTELAAYPSGFGLLFTHAIPPSGDAYGYDLWTSTDGATYYYSGYQGGFGAYAQLATAITVSRSEAMQTALTISYANGDGMFMVSAGDFFKIGDEVFRVVSIDTEAETMSVDPGMMDTVPSDHAVNDYIVFFEGIGAGDPEHGLNGETKYGKLLTKTGQGVLPLGSATPVSVTFASRYQRPYPPGNVRVDSNYYPKDYNGAYNMSWAHRNKETIGLALPDQADSNQGTLPADCEYRIRLYNENGALFKTVTGLLGVSWSYTEADEAFESGVPVAGASGSVWGLYNFNGTDGQTTLTEDANGHTLTNLGCELDTAQKVFGTASLWVQGGSEYVRDEATPSLTGDFCIEGRVRFASLTGIHGVVDKRPTGLSANGLSIFVYDNAGYKLRFCAGDTDTAAWEVSIETSTDVVVDTWYAFAFTREGTTYRAFVNGALLGSVTWAGTLAGESTAKYFIGSLLGAGYSLDGWIDALRIIEGAAVYTAAYTPATSEPTDLSPGQNRLSGKITAELYTYDTANDLESLFPATVTSYRDWQVIDRDLTTPPGSPSDGDVYIPAATATGDWAGHEGKLLLYTYGAWEPITPALYWRAYVLDETVQLEHDGSSWQVV